MDLLGLLSAIWRRKLLAVVMIVLATGAAIATSYKVPSMKPRMLAVGAATSQILVDSNPSTLVAGAGTDQIAALGSRATVYAQYLSSRDAVAQISRATGIPSRLITARGPFSEGTGIKNYQQQPAESRAKDLVDESKTYRLVFAAQDGVPIITVYATGPSAGSALELAKSSFATLQKYVAHLESDSAPALAAQRAAAAAGKGTTGTTKGALGSDVQVVVRQLGAPEGGLVGGGANKLMMILAFIAVFGIQCFFLAAFLRVQEQRRALKAAAAAPVEDLAAAAPIRPEVGEHGEADDAQRARWSRAEYLRG
ncbi:MAG TPA: hypothetical protein VF257_06410 [Solirubrobacteraceae bacterium]